MFAVARALEWVAALAARAVVVVVASAAQAADRVWVVAARAVDWALVVAARASVVREFEAHQPWVAGGSQTQKSGMLFPYCLV